MEQALQSQLSASSGCPGVKKLARASSNPAEPELMQEPGLKPRSSAGQHRSVGMRCRERTWLSEVVPRPAR